MSCVVPEWVTDCHCNKLSVCGKAKQGLQHFVLGSRAGVVHLGGAQRWKGRENWPEEVVNSLLWESVWFMCLTHKHCTVLKYTQAVHSHLFCAWTHTHTHTLMLLLSCAVPCRWLTAWHLLSRKITFIEICELPIFSSLMSSSARLPTLDSHDS